MVSSGTKNTTNSANQSRKTPFEERVNAIFADWNDNINLKQNTPPRFIPTEQTKLLFDNQIINGLSAMLQNYKTPVAQNGMALAIKYMFEDIYTESNNVQRLSKEETKRNLKIGADKLITIFSSKAFVDTINGMEVKLSPYVYDREILSANLKFIAYDPTFSKSYTYNGPEIESKASTILYVYHNYPKYVNFFKSLGLQLPEKVPPLFPQYRLNDVSAYLLVRKSIFIRSQKPNKLHIASFEATHELAHLLQFNGRESLPYGNDYGARKEHVTMNVEKEESVSSIIVEAGAIFIEALGYGWYPKEKLDPHKILDFMEYNPKQGAKVREWIEKLYWTLRNVDNPHHSFYGLVNDYYSRDRGNKYILGTALAALLFTSNKFDVKGTAKDLIKLDKPYLVIEKLAKLIRADKNGDILWVMFRALGPPILEKEKQ